MKKTMLAFFPCLLLCFGYKAMAQDDISKKENKKEVEEIIIRKKGSKDVNLNLQITDDKVLVNGKPLVEFKDDEITVNKKKIIVRDGNRTMVGDMGNDFGSGSFSLSSDDSEGGAFLGVSTEKSGDGAKITEEVAKESAAGKAGLEKDDIITKLNDTKIDGPQSLLEAVRAQKPKDEVKIYYKRNGKAKTTKAVLQERKGLFTKSYSYNGPDGSYKTFTMPYAFDGEKFKNLEGLQALKGDIQGLNNYSFNFPRHQKLGLKIQDTEEGNAVKILEVEDSSAAAIAGLKKDDIITAIGGEKVSNTDEAREQLQENVEKGTYQITARRNGNEMNFDIRIPKKLKTANL